MIKILTGEAEALVSLLCYLWQYANTADNQDQLCQQKFGHHGEALLRGTKLEKGEYLGRYLVGLQAPIEMAVH